MDWIKYECFECKSSLLFEILNYHEPDLGRDRKKRFGLDWLWEQIHTLLYQHTHTIKELYFAVKEMKGITLNGSFVLGMDLNIENVYFI